jgi:hypothetical protein
MTPAKAPLPLLGLWKLTKCETSRPELPHPTAGTAEFIQQEDGVHYINHSLWSTGQNNKSTVTFQLDGNWYPVTGALMHDSLSCQHLPDGSFEFKMRKGEANIGVCHSRTDRNLITAHWEFFLPGGSTVTWETTSELQPAS